jgi:lipoprotein
VQYVKPFSVSILGMLGAACARLIWLNPHNKKQKVTFRRNIALLLKTVL